MRSNTRVMTMLLGATAAGLWSAPVHAFMPDREWGTYLQGYHTSVATDAAGDIYACSWGSSSYEAYLYHLTPAGEPVWTKSFGYPSMVHCHDLAVDGAGNVYVVGSTESDTGIATAGALMEDHAGKLDGFILQVDPDGHLVWGTYLGGVEDDMIHSIAIDANDSLYLAGMAGPLGLALPDGHDPSFNGVADAVLLKVSPEHELLWGTYYGGSELDGYPGVAARDDIVYLVGYTKSSDGIATPGAHDTDLAVGEGDNGVDSFLARFDSDGGRLWGTYFGGETYDCATSVGIMPDGGAALFGQTNSLTGIGTPGAFQEHNSAVNYHQVDAMAARFDPFGAVVWATYFGAWENDLVGGGIVDPAGNLLLTLVTFENEGLATPDAYKPMAEAWHVLDLVVAKFDAAGKRRWSTFVGGDGDDGVGFVQANRPLAAAGLDAVYVVGWTQSDNGVLAGDPPPPQYGAGAFITKLSQGQGDPCADDSECEAGYCVDGVCCDGPCDNGMCVDGVCIVEGSESTGDDTGALTSTGEMSEETGVPDTTTTSPASTSDPVSTGEPASTGEPPSASTTATSADPAPVTTGGSSDATGDAPGIPTTSAGADEGSTGTDTSGPANDDDASGCAGAGCRAQSPAPGGLLVLGLLARRRRLRAR